jgi:hypothetical protein
LFGMAFFNFRNFPILVKKSHNLFFFYFLNHL